MAYRLVHSLSDEHAKDLVALYNQEWWCRGRDIEDVKRMLNGTDLVFGLIDETDDRLVGFCRVITDRVYRGTLYDLIVAEEKRGEKLGRLLMDAVVSHPDLRAVEVLNLFCLPEMEPFYEKWGFDHDRSGTNNMCRGA